MCAREQSSFCRACMCACVRALSERVRERDREKENESESIGQFINVYRDNTNKRANPLCQRYFKGIELKKKKKGKPKQVMHLDILNDTRIEE